jgi:hypothetical protein
MSTNSTDRTPEPLAFTVHSLPAPALDGDAQRRLRSGRLKMLLVLLACAAPVIASYFTYYVVRPEGRTNHGTLIQPSRTMPEALAARTLAGAPVAVAALRRQWLLVSVGLAACGGACEERLYAQRQLREMLGKDADRLDKLWFVTDTAPVAEPLQRALAAAPGMTVLRVDAAALAAWLAPQAGHRIEDHLYLVDPMGEWMMRFPARLEPSKVRRDLGRLMRASNSWDDAGR